MYIRIPFFCVGVENMNLIKKAKQEGLSLRVTFALMLAVSIAITIILLVTTYSTIQSFYALSRATDTYIELEDAASSLMSASDYLTEEAQAYTVMMERAHLDHYFHETEEARRRETALQIMAEKAPDSAALKDLEAAMSESVELMEREYYAMRLILDVTEDPDIPERLKTVELSMHDRALSNAGKKTAAQQLVHDAGYYEKKNEIRSSLSACVEELKKGTHGTEEETARKLRTDLRWITVMIIMQSAGIILILWLTTKLGINPLLIAVEHIKKDQSLPIIGANEFRYLAGTYNKMYAAYKRSIENLSYKASHDELTGVYNRASYDLIKESVDLSTTAFLLIDADHFKAVNDSCGHADGDAVLKKIAAVLKRSFRSDDYICRIGGDEFVVMMVHVDKDVRPLIEQKIRQINKELSDTSDGLPPITISAGISLCRSDENAVEVFHEADIALYHVKDHGRNGCCFYDQSLSQA